jgi:DNA-directed RNA polymerase specialized sigma24 family protein
VLLVAVEGVSPSRAAEIVGASPEAMRQRLSRGRALLTKALEPGQTRRTS